MRLSSKIKLHPLTIGLFLLGCMTGYIKYLLAIFALVFIHEMGHVTMALFFKRKVTSVTLLPFGGLTKMDAKVSENIFEDLLIAEGGILFQTVLGFLLLFLKKDGLLESDMFNFLNSYNTIIILFNLLPICPLDGYKMCKYVSELFMPYRITFGVSLIIGYIILICLIILNLEVFYNNFFIFSFLIFMGIEEYRTRKYLLNRFYLERWQYEFEYKRKDIECLKNAYKNRINYIDGIHEKKVLDKIYGKQG